MPFDKLGLIEPLLRAVRSEGYTVTTPIQNQAIPHILEGKDLLGCAQTGTGKTAAFALPILQLLHDRAPVAAHPGQRRPIRSLILTPTRELAAQIGESFRVYGQHAGLRHTVIFGGVKQGPQEKAFRQGIDILVATPGRLLDLMNQKLLSLKSVEIFVLDEADRMLDMGFINDIRRVITQLPPKRQNLMFSATMPREIQKLADSILHQPVQVRVASKSAAADTVEQGLYHVETNQKASLLEQLLQGPEFTRALVFTRTKRGADRVTRRLVHANIAAEAIHSDKSQNVRLRALENFKRGKVRVLVASDIAARGLDVDDISHVINYDLPNDAETYVHRIGRTGRAGATGQGLSFCSSEQREQLRDIERLLGKSIPVLHCKFKLIATVPAVHSGSSEHGGEGHGRGGPRQGRGGSRERQGSFGGRGSSSHGGRSSSSGRGGHTGPSSHSAQTGHASHGGHAAEAGQVRQAAHGRAGLDGHEAARPTGVGYAGRASRGTAPTGGGGGAQKQKDDFWRRKRQGGGQAGGSAGQGKRGGGGGRGR